MSASHTHAWEETEVYCEDCGSHPAVRCTAGPCQQDFDDDPLDLIFNDDPRETSSPETGV